MMPGPSSSDCFGVEGGGWYGGSRVVVPDAVSNTVLGIHQLGEVDISLTLGDDIVDGVI